MVCEGGGVSRRPSRAWAASCWSESWRVRGSSSRLLDLVDRGVNRLGNLMDSGGGLICRGLAVFLGRRRPRGRCGARLTAGIGGQFAVCCRGSVGGATATRGRRATDQRDQPGDQREEQCPAGQPGKRVGGEGGPVLQGRR